VPLLLRTMQLVAVTFLYVTIALAQDATAPWSGDWRSFWRDGQAVLTLEQSGDTVVGSYAPYDGRIEATADGPVLRGRWIEPTSQGEFTFAIAPDGRSFAGRFGNGEFWNGSRLDPDHVAATPFLSAHTPRDALRTIVTAVNASLAGDADAALVWHPLLTYAPDKSDAPRDLAERRELLNRLVNMMTFRIHEAPSAGNDGRAKFAIGPAGSDATMTLVFVEDREDGVWRLEVPALATLGNIMDIVLEAKGVESYNEYLKNRRSNPRETIVSFYRGVDSWSTGGDALALSTLDLSDISPQLYAIEGPLAADFLRQVMGRLGFLIPQEIPDDPDQVEPYVHYSHAEGDIVVAPVRQADGATKWLFSRETLAASPAIYRAIQNLPLSEGLPEPKPFTDYFRLRAAMEAASPTLLERWLVLENWQWLTLALTVVSLKGLGWGLGRTARGISAWVCKRLAAGPDIREELPHVLDWPLRMVLFGLGLRAVIAQIGLPRDLLSFLGVTGTLLLIAGATTLAYRLAGLIGGYLIRRAAMTKTYVDDIMASLVTGLTKLAVVIVAVFAVADVVGLPYEGVVAGLGVGGLALAIAARDTVSNFFGAAILMADRPFKRGDVVEIDGKVAVVESVGLRSTRLRTFEDSQLMIPNGKLADQTVNNFGRRRQFRLALELGVEHGVPRRKLDAFVNALRDLLLADPRVIRDSVLVGLKTVSNGGVAIDLSCNMRIASFDLFFAGRHEIVGSILACAEESGIGFNTQNPVVNLYGQNPVVSLAS